MPSLQRRNPASQHALTVFEVWGLPVGTRLLVCRMSDYHIGRDSRRPLETRLDSITPVIFRGGIPRPEGRFDDGTGKWVVLDRYIEFGMAPHKEVKRTWWRPSWHAYDPSALGLTVATTAIPGGARPTWNEHDCIIRPEHEQVFRGEYPRRARFQY